MRKAASWYLHFLWKHKVMLAVVSMEVTAVLMVLLTEAYLLAGTYAVMALLVYWTLAPRRRSCG